MAEAPGIAELSPAAMQGEGQDPGQRRVDSHLCDGGWTRGQASPSEDTPGPKEDRWPSLVRSILPPSGVATLPAREPVSAAGSFWAGLRVPGRGVWGTRVPVAPSLPSRREKKQ